MSQNYQQQATAQEFENIEKRKQLVMRDPNNMSPTELANYNGWMSIADEYSNVNNTKASATPVSTETAVEQSAKIEARVEQPIQVVNSNANNDPISNMTEDEKNAYAVAKFAIKEQGQAAAKMFTEILASKGIDARNITSDDANRMEQISSQARKVNYDSTSTTDTKANINVQGLGNADSASAALRAAVLNKVNYESDPTKAQYDGLSVKQAAVATSMANLEANDKTVERREDISSMMNGGNTNAEQLNNIQDSVDMVNSAMNLVDIDGHKTSETEENVSIFNDYVESKKQAEAANSDPTIDFFAA